MRKKTLRVFNTNVAKAHGLNEAIILQQIIYWTGKVKGREAKGFKWVYITHAQLQEQFPFWSLSTIKRGIRSLKKQGVIMTQKERDLIPGSGRTNLHFRGVKMTHTTGQDDPSYRSKRPLVQVKMTHTTGQDDPSLLYTDNTNKDNTKNTYKNGLSPFLEKEKEKFSPRARYSKGEMSQLYKISKKWFDGNTEEFKRYARNYVEQNMRHRPIENKKGYIKTLMIEIWKQQTGQPHETSFEYDHIAAEQRAEYGDMLAAGKTMHIF